MDRVVIVMVYHKKRVRNCRLDLLRSSLKITAIYRLLNPGKYFEARISPKYNIKNLDLILH